MGMGQSRYIILRSWASERDELGRAQLQRGEQDEGSFRRQYRTVCPESNAFRRMASRNGSSQKCRGVFLDLGLTTSTPGSTMN